MNVQTYVILAKNSQPFVSVYPSDYPEGNRAGKIVASNSDSSSQMVLDELPDSAVYCGAYQVCDSFDRPVKEKDAELVS